MIKTEATKPKAKKRRRFWHDGPPLLVDGVVRRGGMFDHQRDWWNLPNFVKLLVTGYGGGKTLQLCKRAIGQTLHNAPVPCAVVSPTFPMARETIITTLEELLNGKSTIVPGLWWRHNKQEHAFTIGLYNRIGRLIVYSGDNPKRLKGPNLAWVGIDEPFIQDIGVFDQMNARIRHPKAKHLEMCLTGTPEQLNWGYELAEGELNARFDVGVIQASTYENLALEKSGYGKRLEESYDDRASQAYVHGQFVNLSTGRVYYAFDTKRHVAKREIVRGDQGLPVVGEFGAGMDFGAARNYASMAAVVFWADDHEMHVTEEYEQQHSDTPYMCETLLQFHKTDGLREIYPDASGQQRQSASGRTDFQALSEYGFHYNAKGQNPGRRDRYNRVNAMLERGRLTIDPKCTLLKRYLSTYTHEQMTKQKQMSHLLDALGYAVCYLFPAERSEILTTAVM